MNDIRFDWDRQQRTGVGEAVFTPGKSLQHLTGLLDDARERQRPLLLTRLQPEVAEDLLAHATTGFDYDAESLTGMLTGGLPDPVAAPVLVVTAGTSDLLVAREAQRTLRFHGHDVPLLADCGVAGLWRLLEQRETLRAARIIIAVAGMEGALFPVVAGLTPALVIAVPTSVGYGIAQGGNAALTTALASCAPGIVTVNIDNGFGAACAAVKLLAAP
jgi:NCAIR mutase (PurE)-related protein